MTDLASVAGKLSSLIRMLGSDKPGEVVAAVEAMRRLLAKVDGDFHALADRVASGKGNGGTLPAASIQQLYKRGSDVGYQAGYEAGTNMPQKNSVRTRTGKKWCGSASTIASNSSRRSGKFIRDMILLWAGSRQPSEKQRNWLRSIYQRVHHPPRRCGGGVTACGKGAQQSTMPVIGYLGGQSATPRCYGAVAPRPLADTAAPVQSLADAANSNRDQRQRDRTPRGRTCREQSHHRESRVDEDRRRSLCEGFRPPGRWAIPALLRPAAEKCQGTKSRDVAGGGAAGYGDFATGSGVRVMERRSGFRLGIRWKSYARSTHSRRLSRMEACSLCRSRSSAPISN